MATKLQLITELSERTANNIAKNPANWIYFLKMAVWNYKYLFQDQLLIHAQHPGATACAPIELWNQKLNRWINRGAKGIALINDRGSKLRLRHVFDVSDTNSPVAFWAIQDRYKETIIETLENTFGELDEKQDMATALLSAAHKAVEDNFSDYLSDLMECWENSFLEEFDDLNVEVIFKDVLESSIAYMFLVRCGYNPDKSSELHLKGSSTFITMNVVGFIISDIIYQI